MSSAPPIRRSPPTDGDDSAPGLTRADVAHLAHLARLELSDAELDPYVGPAVGDPRRGRHRGAVVATPTSSRPATRCPLTNVFREDVVAAGADARAQALDQAPAAEDGRFRVPQILGEEQ